LEGTQESIWSRIDSRIEPWLMTFLYSYFCLIMLVEVVRRHFFGASSQWGEMTARYAFVYLVYIAVAQIAKTRDDIRIDVLPRALGPKGRLILYTYFDLLYLLLVVLVIYYSLQIMGLSIEYGTVMTALDLNVAFAQAALPFGWALLAYRIVQRFVQTLRMYRTRREVPLGGEGFSE
jgi:TRAP-type C4-dicarboxylate transport system permease small subunit